MQYVFFEKVIRNVQGGLGQSPRSWAIFENFCVKSSLKVTFNCKLQENIGGGGCTGCSPNNFVGGALPYCPGSGAYEYHEHCVNV